MKRFTILFALLFSVLSHAQKELKNYEYVFIPNLFHFQDEPNEYNITEVLKTSLRKYNFKAYSNRNNIPDSIPSCEILNVTLNKTGYMTTKMFVVFKDCYQNIIHTSIAGKSRIKQFQPNYYEAIRNALKDPVIQNHQYVAYNKAEKETVTQVKPATKETSLATNDTISFKLEFKDETYTFTSIDKITFSILKDNKTIGQLIKSDTKNYTLNAGSLSGTGHFDDFGNFVLTRTNPVNQVKITDILARIE